MHTQDPSEQATEILRARLGGRSIDWALVAGSGLGVGFVAEVGGIGLQVEGQLPLAELGLPAPSVAGHGNSLVWGRVGGSFVCVQTGRLHPYEGHPIGVCTAPLAAMLACGARTTVLTFAVGGLDPALKTGEVVLLRDQIALFGPTPLVGPQFVDCSQIYPERLRRRVQAIHPGLGPTQLSEVVYAHARGPQYETPAETEALRRLGGQVVGMSTTYEAILCAARGVPVVGLGVVTNGAGQTGLNHHEVQARSQEARAELSGLVAALLATAPGSQGGPGRRGRSGIGPGFRGRSIRVARCGDLTFGAGAVDGEPGLWDRRRGRSGAERRDSGWLLGQVGRGGRARAGACACSWPFGQVRVSARGGRVLAPGACRSCSPPCTPPRARATGRGGSSCRARARWCWCARRPRRSWSRWRSRARRSARR